MDDVNIIEMKNITKYFPGILANDKINLELKKGEVLALLGENGSGKTTLMNILFGLYKQDEGEVFLNGKKIKIHSPSDALNNGIGMVQQHFTIIPSFSVSENVILGLKDEKFFIKTKNVDEKISKIGKEYKLPVDPKSKVWTLSVGEKQRVEILKILYRGANILILDEPTAVLTPTETDSLFKAIRKYTSEGCSVIFISHKLDEVMEISDRVTILRKGKKVNTFITKEINKKILAREMVGRDVLLDIKKPDVEIGEEVLKIENLSVKNDKGLMAVKNLSLSIRKGEILGIAGVSGNGQKELSEAIYGLRKVENGEIIFCNKNITHNGIKRNIIHGISFIPQDRKGVATSPNLSVRENIFEKTFAKGNGYSPFNIRNKEMKIEADKIIKEYSISTPNSETVIKLLSGGNIQKVILARELSLNPELIIASHPTRGLDIGAMNYIYNTLLEEKKKGHSILLLAGELYEIFRLCDRVAVIYEGEIMGYTPPDPDYYDKIGLMMAGTKIGDLIENKN